MFFNHFFSFALFFDFSAKKHPFSFPTKIIEAGVINKVSQPKFHDSKSKSLSQRFLIERVWVRASWLKESEPEFLKRSVGAAKAFWLKKLEQEFPHSKVGATVSWLKGSEPEFHIVWARALFTESGQSFLTYRVWARVSWLNKSEPEFPY